ncbi:MAG TPA: proton-conducting transporter membrane subunit [Kofleriaceae bacterium]|nr:proton-conducting transporter membrane subunit [Kofleriaceae bacterium]
MVLALFLVPLAFAGLTALVASSIWRARLVWIAATIHLVLVVLALWVLDGDMAMFSGWLDLGPLARLALPLISVLFFASALYLPRYLALRQTRPNRMFCSALLVFFAMMTLILVARHLGLMWVALEACTLASAPLVYFNQNSRSLEATWKYVMIGAVGVAIALLGSLFLAYASLRSGLDSSLLFEDLIRQAPQLSRPWLHSAFVLLFVGYGTKMGLAPMHSWKPDAYGESPGLVGGLLAGGLTTCAFVALLRFYAICNAGGEGEFARELMIAIGILSMAVGGVFMARQRDFKRMLAYSSVEHMGILVLGIGIGGLAAYGALLHLAVNALCKGTLFMTAGNIHRAYGAKTTDLVRGALRRVPASGGLFLAAFFAITASPPFGAFVSEFTILRGTVAAGHIAIAAIFLVLLFVVFVGMGATVIAVVQGEPPESLPPNTFHDSLGTVGPPIALLAIVLLLGLYIPAPLDRMIRDAMAMIGTAT